MTKVLEERPNPILIGAMIDMMETHRPAAPSPATALQKIGKFVEDATVQKRLPTLNMHMKTRNTGLAGAIASMLQNTV